MMGLPPASLDGLAAKWKLISNKKVGAGSFSLEQVYLMVSQEKQAQVIETLKQQPAAV